MDWIFRPIIDKWEPLGTKVGKYMDDVAVATCTNLQDHITCITKILELAMQYDLFFKPEKCVFHVCKSFNEWSVEIAKTQKKSRHP